jgi:hypothetical protein
MDDFLPYNLVFAPKISVTGAHEHSMEQNSASVPSLSRPQRKRDDHHRWVDSSIPVTTAFILRTPAPE